MLYTYVSGTYIHMLKSVYCARAGSEVWGEERGDERVEGNAV